MLSYKWDKLNIACCIGGLILIFIGEKLNKYAPVDISMIGGLVIASRVIVRWDMLSQCHDAPVIEQTLLSNPPQHMSWICCSCQKECQVREAEDG